MVIQSELSEEGKILLSDCWQDEGEVFHALHNAERKRNMLVLVALNGKPI
jgi:hypothetical protein